MQQHICTTYSEDPSPGECPGCAEVSQARAREEEPEPLYCYEHREQHAGVNVHSECEACEHERKAERSLSDEELAVFESGAVCDEHLWEQEN